MRVALFALLPLIVACTADSVEARTSDDDFRRTLSVSGTGKAVAAPDMAVLNFGVQAQGTTAGDALNANTKLMNNVFSTLKAMDIEDRDLQTSGFSLRPMYAKNAVGSTNRNKIVGYQTFNTLTVRVRDTDDVGGTIDKVIGAGVNNFNGLSFTFQNPDKLMEEARRNAVRNARAVAELMAEEAGVSLGPVLTMSQSSRGVQPQPRMMMREMAVSADTGPPPVAAGEGELLVTVHMVYELD